MYITGETKITGLLGDPVIYSLSPAMHNAAFQYLQQPYVYLPFHVTKDNLAAAVEALRALAITGVNVTVPHKESIIPYLDQLDESARHCGAVNTIINQAGTLTGYNTDGAGFFDSLQEVGFTSTEKRIVILGAGGAARAVATSLLAQGIKDIIIINRTLAKAEQLAESLGNRVSSQQLQRYTTPDIPGTSLVVNTLSIPFKEEGKWLLDLSEIQGALFYDLRYGKMPSDFLEYAQELNSPGLDGLGMLLHQGARAFTLFTGQVAPLAVMRSAINLDYNSC
ncbi:MAG: shikimate dehydrogenase [Firmicutes bacterium]|nr:shikimate dehydrogenase [Bacillota bacterium]